MGTNGEPHDSPGGALTFDQATMDYMRVERAIKFLVSHHLEQPDLATVARHVHLSEYHFQRLFSRWAGISPKRFLQCLAVEHAKRRLAESKALFDVTLDSGLSSPGRLHDLFVSVEAMTPNEFKERGTGLRIHYGFHASPFGKCLMATADRGVCGLSFVESGAESDAVVELRAASARSDIEERPEATAPRGDSHHERNASARRPKHSARVGSVQRKSCRQRRRRRSAWNEAFDARFADEGVEDRQTILTREISRSVLARSRESRNFTSLPVPSHLAKKPVVIG